MIQIVLIGFIVGLCISYSGVGAGSLTTPLIVLFLGYDASTAIGSDLLFSLGTKIVAFLTHIRAQTVNYGALLFLSLGGVPGAIVGVLVTGWLHAHLPIGVVNHVLKIALGIALLIAAAAVAFTRSVAPDKQPPAAPLPHVPLAVIGFVVGTLVSITSIGSGSLTLPLLLLVLSQAHRHVGGNRRCVCGGAAGAGDPRTFQTRRCERPPCDAAARGVSPGCAGGYAACEAIARARLSCRARADLAIVGVRLFL